MTEISPAPWGSESELEQRLRLVRERAAYDQEHGPPQLDYPPMEPGYANQNPKVHALFERIGTDQKLLDLLAAKGYDVAKAACDKRDGIAGGFQTDNARGGSKEGRADDCD